MTTVQVQITRQIPPVLYQGWRCLHMAEGGDPHQVGAPAVHNSESIAGIDFTEPMQLLSYQINRRTNPLFTPNRWRSVYDTGTAFTNGQGYGIHGDPRADFVSRQNLTNKPPRLMRGIICSGSFYRGFVEQTEKGEMLTLYPGRHGIDVNGFVGYDETFIQYVLDNNFYFYAINADLSAASHFAQGVGMPVIIPLFLKVPTRYPVSWFTPWQEDFLPNPTTFYLRL